MHLPDYQGGSIVNLMASLQAGLNGDVHAYAPLAGLSPAEVGAHRQVLLWVIDGLGLHYLQAHPQAAHLNAHLRGQATSVFPPTTATAITTYLTGDAPQQHGLTGWHMYFRELASVLAVLPARARFGGAAMGEAGVDLAQLLDHRAFAERIAVAGHVVTPDFLADSDFTRAHLGGARLSGFRDLDDMVARCAASLREPGRRFVYAYWPRLDSLGHRCGIHSDEVAAHLAELDQAFGRLLDALRGTDTLVVVTADHGQIDVPARQWIDLDDHPVLRDCLVLPLCGEPRAAYCYLRPGAEAVFDEYVGNELDGIADGLPAQRLLDEGWFGLGEPHARLAERVGDRVLLLRDGYALKDWLPHERRFAMTGVHGGLSADEMLVPLLVAEC